MSGNSAHVKRVCGLYRNSLRMLLSYQIDRAIWANQAVLLRNQFDEQKNIVDKDRIELVLSKGEALLREYRHPDPYITPTSPGGTKWQRNTPPPIEFCKDEAFEYQP